MDSTLPPSRRSSSAAFSIAGSSATMIKSNFFRAHSRANASPMPVEAPVTTARLLTLSSMDGLLACDFHGFLHARLEDDLDAAVLLLSKGVVELGSFFERGRMGDDHRGVDAAFLDELKQGWQIVLDGSLRHPKREATIDRRPHRNLVEETPVDADDRHHTEVAAAMDGLAQHMRPVAAHEGRGLDAVPTRVETGGRLGLGTDRIDAGIGAAPARQVHDPLIDIFLHEIERLRSGLARK